MHCSRRLIVQTLVFSRSYLHRQVSTPEILVVKGGTTLARNGRWILPEYARLPRNIHRDLLHAVNLHGTNGFTLLPKEGVLRIFFRPEKSDGFGRVWTRELGYTMCLTIKITQPFRRLGLIHIIIFPAAAREPAHNNGCGPFAIKRVDAYALEPNGHWCTTTFNTKT